MVACYSLVCPAPCGPCHPALELGLALFLHTGDALFGNCFFTVLDNRPGGQPSWTWYTFILLEMGDIVAFNLWAVWLILVSFHKAVYISLLSIDLVM